MSLREAIAALADDSRKVARLPEPIAATVLEAAPEQGLHRPLAQAVNLQRYVASRAAEPQPEFPSTFIQASGPPASPYPGADLELAAAILALCRESAAGDPTLTPSVVRETLNAVYCEVEACGLAGTGDLAA